MVITKQQAKLIAELAGQIQEKYGFIIGYSNPAIPLPPQRGVDFMIFDNPEVDDLQCFHKDDIEERPMGPHMVLLLPAEPEHDNQVQDLLDRLNNDLLEGNLWFEPTITKAVDGLVIEITKKKFPGTDEDIFATNIETNRFGTAYTYAFISEAADHDRRFRIAKDIIDENWPRKVSPKIKESQDQSQGKEGQDQLKLKFFLSKIFRMFGI